MSTELVADFAVQFPGGMRVQGSFRQPADRFYITALFGPSGGGKTTVLRGLAGLERPARGRIQFREETWFDPAKRMWQSPQQRRLGYLSQDYALFPHLSVGRNIAYGLRDLTRTERDRRVEDLVALFQLGGLEHRYPGQISGGQQQRVALARALARRPRLLLLDEPLSALDAPTREPLRGELRRMLSAFGLPAVIVTHDRAEATALADQVVVLDGGVVRQRGPAAEVFARPVDAAVAAIVGVENILPGRVVGVENGVTAVDVGGVRLRVAAVGPSSGPVVVCVRAEDVSLTGEDGPADVIRGTVVSATPEGPLVRVQLDAGLQLTALVPKSVADLMQPSPGEPIGARVCAAHLVAG